MHDWSQTRLTTVAVATTGTDPATSALCGYALTTTTSDGTIHGHHHTPVRATEPIPAEASAIHGIDAAAARWGATGADAAADLYRHLTDPRAVLVAFNAPWVLATINAHMARHDHAAITVTAPLIDPLVLDKANQSRAASGNRTLPAIRRRWNLADLAYGPAPTNALGAAELAHTLIAAVPRFRDQTPDALSAQCGSWYYETEEDYRGFLRSVGKEPTGDILTWPARRPAAT